MHLFVHTTANTDNPPLRKTYERPKRTPTNINKNYDGAHHMMCAEPGFPFAVEKCGFPPFNGKK